MMLRRLFLTLTVAALLMAAPVSAASPRYAEAQQRFHAVVDTYLRENADLSARVTEHSSLDERTKSTLMSLVRGQESRLLDIRSRVYSTTSTREVATLAQLAKQQRALMKREERVVIMPILQLTDFEQGPLIKAEQRVALMRTSLTDARLAKIDEELVALHADVDNLQEGLLSSTPPANAPTVIKGLQARLKGVYRLMQKR